MRAGGGRGRPKRVQLAVPPSPASSPSSFRPGASDATATTTPSLGPLLRMFSELSKERQRRAFDFVSQLHALEHPEEHSDSFNSAISTTVGKPLDRAESPPPRHMTPLPRPPTPPMQGRPRPRPLEVPANHSTIEPEHAQAPTPPQLPFQPPSAQPGAELRVTLTGEQLRRISETFTTPADPLDGLVSSYFSPSREPYQQPSPAYHRPVSQFAPPGQQLPPTPHAATAAAGNESIYSMLPGSSRTATSSPARGPSRLSAAFGTGPGLGSGPALTTARTTGEYVHSYTAPPTAVSNGGYSAAPSRMAGSLGSHGHMGSHMVPHPPHASVVHGHSGHGLPPPSVYGGGASAYEGGGGTSFSQGLPQASTTFSQGLPYAPYRPPTTPPPFIHQVRVRHSGTPPPLPAFRRIPAPLGEASWTPQPFLVSSSTARQIASGALRHCRAPPGTLRHTMTCDG